MRLVLIFLVLSVSAFSEQFTPRDYAIAGQIETGVPIAITLAVVEHESGGNLAHNSIKCANGTFDLGAGFNSRWIGWYSRQFNHGAPIKYKSPESIIVVARALAWNYRSFGNWPEALTAYRRGQSWTKANGVDKHYVDKIIALLAGNYDALPLR